MPAADVRRKIIISASLITGVLLVLFGTFRLIRDLQLGTGALTAVQAVLAAACLAGGLRIRQGRPEARSGYALIYLAAMFYLGAIGLGGYTLQLLTTGNEPWLLLLGGGVVAALGAWVRFLYLHGLGVSLIALALGTWLDRGGLAPEHASLAVAAGLVAAGGLLGRRLTPHFRLMYLAGGFALAVLTAWGMEITAAEAHRWPNALLLTGCALAPLAWGFRESDDTIAVIGIMAIVLDVYTQYYFLFWNWAPRTLFFLVGGLITLGFGISYERFVHRKLFRPAGTPRHHAPDADPP